ncbi:MAG: ComF family protein [Clostridia bacterium]|nr:ComF family protein [Clostridia bacterium]
MNLLDTVLDFIFPSTCGFCDKMGEGYLCQDCKRKITNSNFYFNQLDFYQNKDTFIDEHFYLFSYTEPIRGKILQYKFEDKAYLANTIYEFFMNNEKLYGFLKKYDIMIPIPISSSRKRERGYNQSELLARKISKMANIHIETQALKKAKNNQPQSSLNKEQRRENVKNVYKVQNELKIQNKKILLFDDIYTTGSTANECARMLRAFGSQAVGILTIARDLQKYQKRKE